MIGCDSEVMLVFSSSHFSQLWKCSLVSNRSLNSNQSISIILAICKWFWWISMHSAIRIGLNSAFGSIKSIICFIRLWCQAFLIFFNWLCGIKMSVSCDTQKHDHSSTTNKNHERERFQNNRRRHDEGRKRAIRRTIRMAIEKHLTTFGITFAIQSKKFCHSRKKIAEATRCDGALFCALLVAILNLLCCYFIFCLRVWCGFFSTSRFWAIAPFSLQWHCRFLNFPIHSITAPLSRKALILLPYKSLKTQYMSFDAI